MLLRILAILCTVSLSLLAQPTPSAAAKAYSEAIRSKDPVNKLVALENFVTNFPKAGIYLRIAYSEILKLRISAPGDPASTARIRSYRTLLENSIPRIEAERGGQSIYLSNAAEELLNANLPPKEAEFWSRKALALVDEAAYKSDLMKMMKNSKPAPADSFYQSQFADFKAQRLSVLGRALQARGKTGKAQESFEQALKLSSTEVNALNGLAIIADRKNKSKQALDYSAAAILSGKPKPETRAIFLRHIGREDAESFLDNVYKSKFPSPIRRDILTRNKVEARRVVLAEVFTGAGCPPCVAADLAFDGIMESYAPNEVAVLMYHVHVPRPDPLSNPDTVDRAKYYAMRGVPSYGLDGKTEIGGGSRDMTESFFTALRPKIDAALAIPNQGTLKIDLSSTGGVVEVKVQSQSSANPKQRLWIALAEKQIRYSGENGVRFHPLVVRSMKSFDIQPSESSTHTAVFDLTAIETSLKSYLDGFEESNERFGKVKFMAKPLGLSAANMTAVAFIEDPSNKSILSTVMFTSRGSMNTQ